MAKTYYTALKVEHKLPHSETVLMAGMLLKVSKWHGNLVRCTELYNDRNPQKVGGSTYFFTQDVCRSIMLKPSTDLDFMINESINICEATYC